MFGKPRDITETATIDTGSFDEILGDEAAAENALEVHELRHRLEQVESQISSQFTSLATYAQIAQEQVELARAEAKAATERSEERVTSLVERERADRMSASTGTPAGSAPADSTSTDSAPAGSPPDVTARLDSLEQSVAHLTRSLDECRQWQKELALAITEMFERLDAPSSPVQAPAALETPPPPPVPLATEPSLAPPASFDAPPSFDAPVSFDPPSAPTTSCTDGPITGLALEG